MLIAILLMLILHPFLESYIAIGLIMNIFFSAILFAGVYAFRARKGHLLIGLVLAIPVLIARWSQHFVPIPSLILLGNGFGILFFGFVTSTILYSIFEEEEITLDVICGAICAYLLVGLLWAFIFSSLEDLYPGSFLLGENRVKDLKDFVYFSFVTLTTLGYGDITVLGPGARSFAVLEAIVGQLYLTILIARLVGIHISQSMRAKPG
jgi:hypothetical protein